MKPCVYIIQCDEGFKYFGSTKDLTKRLDRHASKKVKFTSKYSNWKLIGFKEFETIHQARLFERKIKKSHNAREKFLKEIIGE